jgi:paraquat-inducible protein A
MEEPNQSPLTSDEIPEPGELVGCPDCDLLIRKVPVKDGYYLRCPRCDAVLLRSIPATVNRTMALSIAGLLLFIPACFMPLLKLNILGYSGYCTMVKGVIQMYHNGYLWMTFLVLFCSVLVPFTVLCLLFAISVMASTGRFTPLLVKAMKLHHHLTEWTMLDVYMIGILIALIKMKDYGTIAAGLGLYCFAALLGITTLSVLSFESHAIWALIEDRQ